MIIMKRILLLMLILTSCLALHSQIDSVVLRSKISKYPIKYLRSNNKSSYRYPTTSFGNKNHRYYVENGKFYYEVTNDSGNVRLLEIGKPIIVYDTFIMPDSTNYDQFYLDILGNDSFLPKTIIVSRFALLKHGKYVQNHYETGIRCVRGQFKNGIAYGWFRFYDKEGFLISKGKFKKIEDSYGYDGILHGYIATKEVEYFYENKQLVKIKKYRMGKLKKVRFF